VGNNGEKMKKGYKPDKPVIVLSRLWRHMMEREEGKKLAISNYEKHWGHTRAAAVLQDHGQLVLLELTQRKGTNPPPR
jgi:hypothetical protein